MLSKTITGWNAPDDKGNRWVETLEGTGLRFVNEAHKIRRSLAVGWYCDTFQDETYVAVVLRMSAKHGQERFLAAHKEPWNDGYRVMCQRNGNLSLFDCAEDAAYAADGYTAGEAEAARTYDEAWQEGAQHAALVGNIAEERDIARALLSEIKAAGKQFSPTICAVLRAKLRSLRVSITKAREERDALADKPSWFIREYGDAFNDGAGTTVLNLA